MTIYYKCVGSTWLGASKTKKTLLPINYYVLNHNLNSNGFSGSCGENTLPLCYSPMVQNVVL